MFGSGLLNQYVGDFSALTTKVTCQINDSEHIWVVRTGQTEFKDVLCVYSTDELPSELLSTHATVHYYPRGAMQHELEFLTHETTYINKMAKKTTFEIICQKTPPLSGGTPGQATRGTYRLG
jgi:hypothetical protein